MCGIFGIDGCDDAAHLTYLGLYALQHRGQESAGIVSWNGAQLHLERHMGGVREIFKESVIARLPGHRAIGHTRYSTAGSSSRTKRASRRSKAQLSEAKQGWPFKSPSTSGRKPFGSRAAIRHLSVMRRIE